jgi:hypothetical protein
MRGLLRCQYKLNEFADAAANAQDLLQQKGIATDDKSMANMVIAKNYQTTTSLMKPLMLIKLLSASVRMNMQQKLVIVLQRFYYSKIILKMLRKQGLML